MPLKLVDPRMMHIARHPGAFALGVLRDFQANQGLLLAGAVAYYALLSVVPLLILSVIALSHVANQAALLEMLGGLMEYVAPGEGRAIQAALGVFMAHHAGLGWVLMITLIFFSSLGFKVLESAISVIFTHRIETRKRHFLVSKLLLPVGYILFIVVGLFAAMLLSVSLAALGDRGVEVFGHVLMLDKASGWLLYAAGMAGEILLFSSIYYFMPVGRLTVRHALIGGVTATLLWEIVRHVLGWYLHSLSQVNVVYGSFAAAIVVLLSLELAATILLLGAQVIACYERITIDEGEEQA